ncbi:MAG: nuclear transport factor 2 family protein [Pyrinomonadaceae bacterium]
MHRLLLIFLLLTVACAAQAQERRAEKPSKIEQEILKLNQSWADAITHGDMKTLDALFADEMIVTSGSGMVRDKAGELNDLRPSPETTTPPSSQNTNPFKTDDVRVRAYKDSAVLTGRAKWKFTYQGREIDNQIRYTHVYVKQQGSWRIVAQHVSRIAQPPK